MTFYDYVITNYKGCDTPAGDLAYDMERDGRFPKVSGADSATHDELKLYIIRSNACFKISLRVFEKCWKNYVKSKQAYEPAHSKVVEVCEGITYWDACGRCKRTLDDDWKYCPECGAKLER